MSQKYFSTCIAHLLTTCRICVELYDEVGCLFCHFNPPPPLYKKQDWVCDGIPIYQIVLDTPLFWENQNKYLWSNDLGGIYHDSVLDSYEEQEF